MRVINTVVLITALATAACSGDEDAGRRSSTEAVQPKSLLEIEQAGKTGSTDSQLRADKVRYDFGRVPINGGDVETIFTLSNDGPTPVRLVAVFTSCGCTTAELELADGSKAGPFGMPGHGLPNDINRTLGVGASLQVRVVFNPAAHGPDGLGKIMRTVTVHTEDGGTAQLEITAEVVRA